MGGGNVPDAAMVIILPLPLSPATQLKPIQLLEHNGTNSSLLSNHVLSTSLGMELLLYYSSTQLFIHMRRENNN